MPLTNFGAILNFAEAVEQADMEFYRRAASTGAAAPHRDLFEALAEEGKKNISMVQRTRRENVTEMILEPIRGFVREGYQESVGAMESMGLTAILATAVSLENRSLRYYTDAAQKIRALPEVSRALKALAKKRTRRLDQLQALSR
jgi:rubrerythrin